MKLQSSLLSAAILGVLALSSAAATAATDQAAVARARAAIDAGSLPAVARHANDAFIAKDSNVDMNGTEHVRFQRTWNGMPVIGGDFIVHNRNGRTEVTTNLDTSFRPSATPKLRRDEALGVAGARFGTRATAPADARLVVFAVRRQPTLAWEVVYEGIRADQTPTEMHYFIDASSGEVLAAWDAVHTATPGPDTSTCPGGVSANGKGNTLGAGRVSLRTTSCANAYQLRDLTRGGGSTTNMLNRTTGNGTIFTDADNQWGSGTLSDMATIGAEAHYGVAATWDWFASRFGRMGIADDGQGALARVHYGRNYANAFWRDSCFCMTFGDGDNGVSVNPLTALDVAAHEMSHGVTSTTAGLIYSDESGGLNEATSDIFAVAVEFAAKNDADAGDWMIGEKVYANNDGTVALRYMFKPSLDGASYDCYEPGMGLDDVHFTSGVANHFFYLLSEGAVVPEGFGPGTWAGLTPEDMVCNGNTNLGGLGVQTAARIWYYALVNYMLPTTDYAGARAATLQAAADLHGAGSSAYKKVARAWDAVGVTADL
ncbi:M4 family metallopeptidase [Arenimonas composti]|uniref:Neutral metalloproteinase n=1 Tax=Arenimonas composti TR7-09 = DSM 18010 TaxID=1121013 RepID=A0A091BEX7_9GAMM|nr:M4 family metallopeptidase [Arenimonas composti]KFN50077.1 hypothetical protein P873_00870 [Arenimonas composti TR7-09 = DSM 18010]